MAASDPKQKPVAKADERTANSDAKPNHGTRSQAHATSDTPAGAGSAPIDPSRLQPGEAVGAPITTNPPRGVGEAPSNQIADEPAAGDLQRHVQSVIDDEEARGFRGVRRTKPVPNSVYTLQGVGRGDPTPETVVVTPRGE